MEWYTLFYSNILSQFRNILLCFLTLMCQFILNETENKTIRKKWIKYFEERLSIVSIQNWTLRHSVFFLLIYFINCLSSFLVSSFRFVCKVFFSSNIAIFFVRKCPLPFYLFFLSFLSIYWDLINFFYFNANFLRLNTLTQIRLKQLNKIDYK